MLCCVVAVGINMYRHMETALKAELVYKALESSPVRDNHPNDNKTFICIILELCGCSFLSAGVGFLFS